MSKNLFSFATKELSQDAFLRWFFESWEDEEIKPAVFDFLEKVGIETTGIKEIVTVAQKDRIDVSVYIYSDKIQALYIEDKTTSFEHNQLINYNQSIKKQTKNLDNVVKLYYKTFLINDDERIRVNDAAWTIFELNDILTFWNKYLNSSNLILKSYAEHVCDVCKSLSNTTRPIDNDLTAWTAYFHNVLVPYIKKNYNCICHIGKETHNGYTLLEIFPYDFGVSYPYFEINSRTCSNNCFKAFILAYGVDENKYQNIKDNIRNAATQNSIFNANFKASKTICSTKKYENLNDNDFLTLFTQALNDFFKIIDSAK